MNINLLKVALSQYGVLEMPGSEHNPEILKYFAEIGQTWVKTDETAWCSAFVNWCAKTAGLKITGKLTARSWLEIGAKVDHIEYADIVVFWRESPNSWKGHVGLPIREDDDIIWTLGGNQSNMVKVSAYPLVQKLAYIKLPLK